MNDEMNNLSQRARSEGSFSKSIRKKLSLFISFKIRLKYKSPPERRSDGGAPPHHLQEPLQLQEVEGGGEAWGGQS